MTPEEEVEFLRRVHAELEKMRRIRRQTNRLSLAVCASVAVLILVWAWLG